LCEKSPTSEKKNRGGPGSAGLFEESGMHSAFLCVVSLCVGVGQGLALSLERVE